MSETNNNIPMRITQLQEATAYEDGMYYAVAKAGSGTKKISCDAFNQPLENILKTNDSPKLLPVAFTTNSGFIGIYGDIQSDSNSKYTKIDVIEGEKYYVSCYLSGNRSIAFYNGDSLISVETVSTLGIDELVDYEFTMPTNCTVFGVTTYLPSTYPIKIKKIGNEYVKCGDIKEQVDYLQEVAYSTNLLDLDAITPNKYMNKNGATGGDNTYCYTDFIPVKQGDDIAYYVSYFTSTGLKYITAFDSEKNVIPSKGWAEGETKQPIQEGVSFVVLTLYQNKMEDDGRVNINGIKPFEPFWKKVLPLGVNENLKELQKLKQFPLTTLSSYILNNLSYKPLGYLEKGYICLVSDDGDIDLANYTIPMLISKNVVGTFGLMKSSEVMQDATALATVVDSVENHGCKIAQHGGFSWVNYNEAELVQFFDDEADFMEQNGLTPTSGVCPAHGTNKIVKAVAGGRWGVCRSGYGSTGAPEYEMMAGARSNLFALPSQNIIEYDLDYWKAKVDLAIANHYILIPFFHENELTSTQKTKLEAVIDYAKSQNVEFITLDQIPNLK